MTYDALTKTRAVGFESDARLGYLIAPALNERSNDPHVVLIGMYAFAVARAHAVTSNDTTSPLA